MDTGKSSHKHHEPLRSPTSPIASNHVRARPGRLIGHHSPRSNPYNASCQLQKHPDYIHTFYARVLAWERVKAPWLLPDDIYQLWFLRGLSPEFQNWKTTVCRTKNVGRMGGNFLPATSLDELRRLAAGHAVMFGLDAAQGQSEPQYEVGDDDAFAVDGGS